MARYDDLKRERTVIKEVFVPGKFTCAEGTYSGSQGLLSVHLTHVTEEEADIVIGIPKENANFTVNKETAKVLSDFFAELSTTLEQ